MATASNPSPPRGGGAATPSPWVHIVRGTDSVGVTSNAAAVAAVALPPSPSAAEKVENFEKIEKIGEDLKSLGNGMSFLESGSGWNGDQVLEDGGKKPVWNRVSSTKSEGGVGPVMGAVSWPALSESTKGAPKSISPEPIKSVLDGSPSVSQGTGMFSPFSHRQGIGSNANPSPIPNHVSNTRQRPNRRFNGGGSDNPSNNMSSNGGLASESAPNGAGKSAHSAGEPSAKENMHREGGGQRGGSGSHGGGEHQQRNSYRRGSSGAHPREGSQNHSHGGRRDQDRGTQDWNPHRNFGSRDAQMQHQRGSSRPFFRGPSHANMAYIPPPPFPFRPPFGTPMMYPGPDVPTPVFYAPPPHLDPFRAVPLVAPIAPVYFPFADPNLHMKIVNQIEYYFSNENIVKDTYLRQNMDEQGWVPIKLIAGFNLVYQLTDDIQQILAALQSSALLEVEGEKVRRRDDWPNWIIPQSAQHSGASSPQSTPKSGNDNKLTEHLQSLALNDSSIPSRSSSGEFSSR